MLANPCILCKLQDNIKDIYLDSLTQIWFLGDVDC